MIHHHPHNKGSDISAVTVSYGRKK